MNNKKLLLHLFFTFIMTVSAMSQQVTVRHLSGNGIEIAGNTIIDHAGNVIVWGSFAQTMDFDPSAAIFNLTSANPSNDGFVAKYNSTGALLWAVDFASNTYGATNAVDVDKDDNLYITGAFFGTVDADPSSSSSIFTSAGDVDFFITKLTPSGSYVWAKHFGGSGLDQADDIKTNELSAFYISGIFSNTVDFDPSAGVSNMTTTFPGTINEVNRTFMAKYDLDGNIIWAENVGGRGGSMFVNKNSTTNDYVLLASGGSAFNSTAEDFDPGANTVSPVPAPLPGANYAVIAKYTSGGKYVWADFFRTFLSMNVSAGPGIAKVIQDAAKNIYAGGSFVTSFAEYPDNIISLTPIGSVYTDAMLLKLSSNGSLIWQKKIGAPDAFDYISDLTLDGSGNVVISGAFGGFANNAVADFNIPGAPSTLTSYGNYDGFVAAYTPGADLLYAGNIGGTGSDNCSGIAVSGSTAWLFGAFEAQADCDPFTGVTNLTSNGANDLFLDSYTLPAVSCDVPTTTFTTNPSATAITLNWTAVNAANKYKVRYRLSSSNIWMTSTTVNTFKKLKNLLPSTSYSWQVRAVCSDAGLGVSSWSGLQEFTTLPMRLEEASTTVAVNIFPNPVSSTATISFTLTEPSAVSIELFSADGKKILNIANENFSGGNQEISFDAQSLAQGIYLLRMQTPGWVITKKLVIE